MVKVYAVNVSEIDVTDGRILGQMSEKRLEKIKRLKPEKSKKQSVGAELALNYALSREAGLCPPANWETDENGKLYIPDTSFYVNLSHSGDYAVCAIADSVIGVDIERIKAVNPSLAKRFFTEAENEFIKSSPNSGETFCDIWVKKESVIKAVGKGLAIPLSSFSVLGKTTEYNGVTYAFKRYSIKDSSYKLCVAFAV